MCGKSDKIENEGMKGSIGVTNVAEIPIINGLDVMREEITNQGR